MRRATVLLLALPLLLAARPSGQVVARVGDRVITRALLDAAVDQALNSRFRHAALTHERRLQLEREQLRTLIRKELSVLGGLDAGMELPLQEAERRRREIRERLGRKRYREGLRAAGMTVRQHRRAIAETLLAEQAYRRFVKERAAVTDADVRAAYDADPGRWRRPEARRLRHLVLAVPPGADAATVARVEREARELLRRIRAGEPFEKLAAERSADMYRIRGGDLGWVHRGRLLPELEAAAWSATVGEVVGPIRTDTGYHLLQILEVRPEAQLSFDEAAPMIRKKLEAERLEAAESAWFGELARRHPVAVLVPELAAAWDGAGGR